ncbi:MAG TPA: hypothetical protein VLW88_08730, partial [Hyphomicrobium sp.]|nr:hypothetical protein [Hyphomicrobium sp.]
MAGNYDGSLMELLPEEDPCRLLINEAKQLGREKIYVDTKKVEIEIGAYSTTDTLLREFCVAALERAKALEDSSGEFKPSWKSQLVLRLLGDHAPSKDNKPPGGWTPYQCLRRAIDYVSGMADNYAVYVAKQLQGGGFAGGQRP